MSELEPCPKCHKNTKLVMRRLGSHTMRMDCENCGYWLEVGWCGTPPTEQMMADRWNSWTEYRKKVDEEAEE